MPATRLRPVDVLRRSRRARPHRAGRRPGHLRPRAGVRGRARSASTTPVLALAKDDGAEYFMFPPTIDRTILEKTDYMDSFPHLVGHGPQLLRQGARRAPAQRARSTPASRGTISSSMTDVVPEPGRVLSALSELAGHGARSTADSSRCSTWVFRHEPSIEPTRMQAFRVREFVRCGTPDQVVEWRDMWLKRGVELLESLGLPAQLGRRDRSVLRQGRQDARGQPARAEAQVRGARAGDLRGESDRASARSTITRTTSATRSAIRTAGRRDRAHRVPRLRPRARDDGAVPDARLRSGALARRSPRGSSGREMRATALALDPARYQRQSAARRIACSGSRRTAMSTSGSS